MTGPVAYSQGCCWWDSTDAASLSPAGVMLCPFCKSKCGLAPTAELAGLPQENRGHCDKENR